MTKKRSNAQLKKTSACRARVFDFLTRFSAVHQWTMDGPADTEIDEIMCFAYRGGTILVGTWWHGGWTLLTEPSADGDLDVLERAMRLQLAEREEPGHPNAAHYAPLLCSVMDKLLEEVDGEIEQRKCSGNAEVWAELANLSSTAHAILAMVKAGGKPMPNPDYGVVAINAIALLHENQEAWEGEEQSVKEEKEELMARNDAFLNSLTPSAEVRLPVTGMTPDGFADPGPAVGDAFNG